MRPLAVVASVLASWSIAGAEPRLVDPAAAATQELDRAYDLLLARPHPHYLLPALENVGAVVGGLVWYWLDRERQVGDWDFPSLEQRLTFEAWRFDNNPFPINFTWHAVDGAEYHLFARSNDLSMLASIGYGLGTSLAWEFGVEFREKVSINDVIVTTSAGTVLGETFHWLGRYFESAPAPRWWHPIPRWTLTTNRALHNAMFGIDRLRKGTTPDHLGFSSDIWHRFTLSGGLAQARISGDERPTLVRLGGTTEIAGIPGYLTASELARTFTSANISSGRLRVDLGDDAIGVDFSGDAMLVGHHRQRLIDGAGWATTLGLDLAYRYRRDLVGSYVERIAQTHLPGIAVDQHVRFNAADVPVWLRARVRANYDFAGVHAYAYDTWRAAQPDDIIEKEVLSRHGYYYGWGPSVRADLEVVLPYLAVGGSVEVARYASQEGYDRTQERVTVDIAARDRFIDTVGWLRLGTEDRRAYVEARVERHERESTVGDVTEPGALSTFLISIGTEQ